MAEIIQQEWTNNKKGMVTAAAVAVAVFLTAYFVSTKNYLLFHTFAELFAIIISFTIALIVFHNLDNLRTGFIPIIGITYTFAGMFDVLHMLAYKGLGVFPDAGADLGTQMWIIARYLNSIGLLAAGLSLDRKIKPSGILLTFSAMSVAAVLAVFYWQVFPVCFSESQGLTPFKVYSEYIISLMLVASVLLLIRHKEGFHTSVYRLMLAFFLVSVCSELVFTLYLEVYGPANFIGHVLKVIAYFFLYRAIIEKSLTEPFNLLFFQINQMNKELKSFANIVAHDFRAPLVNIKGFSREIEYTLDSVKQVVQPVAVQLPDNEQKHLRVLLEKDVPEALGFIYAAVEKMDRMVAALLKLSRIGRRELHYEKIRTSELVTMILQSFNHQIAEKNITVKIGMLPTITSDRFALEQIISNLLDNAIKYLEPGRPGQIDFYCWCADDEEVFCIEDNGRGIAAGDQERVFEVFQRIDSDSIPGEGMGLAYVKALVRRLGGKVWCHSEPGIGTKICFTVR